MGVSSIFRLAYSDPHISYPPSSQGSHSRPRAPQPSRWCCQHDPRGGFRRPALHCPPPCSPPHAYPNLPARRAPPHRYFLVRARRAPARCRWRRQESPKGPYLKGQPVGCVRGAGLGHHDQYPSFAMVLLERSPLRSTFWLFPLVCCASYCQASSCNFSLP